jgi:hypothetical protein
MAPDGARVEFKERNAAIKYDRPISTNGLMVQDPGTNAMVDIRYALQTYLEDVQVLGIESPI